MGFKTLFGQFIDTMRPTGRELKFVINRIKRNPLSLVGVIILLIFIAVALLAPQLAPPTSDNPYMIAYSGPHSKEWIIEHYSFTPLPTPPSATHPFGTLEGHDIFYGCIWGTRTAFRVSLIIIISSLVIGLFVGGIAGYHGGLIGEGMMRFTDIFFAIPDILLAMILIVSLQIEWARFFLLRQVTTDFSLMDKLIIAIILVRWPSYARLIRGEILGVKNQDFVEAAKAIGCSSFRVLVRHILPNVIYPILIMAFLDIGGVVLSFTTLSFLGFGPEMGYAEWATLIGTSRKYIIGTPQDPFKYAYTFFWPGLFITGFILAWSLIGDALREIMDPTLRRI